MTKSQTPRARNSKDRVVVVNPSGPHHRDKCRTWVNASNTTSRGAPIEREITISRSLAARSPPLLVVVIVWSLLPRVLQLLHVLVQPVEARAPEPLEAAHPLVDRPQPPGVQAVQPLLAPPVDAARAPRTPVPCRRCLPAWWTRTSPTSRSTRRCLDVCGWVIPRFRASSVTG